MINPYVKKELLNQICEYTFEFKELPKSNEKEIVKNLAAIWSGKVALIVKEVLWITELEPEDIHKICDSAEEIFFHLNLKNFDKVEFECSAMVDQLMSTH